MRRIEELTGSIVAPQASSQILCRLSMFIMVISKVELTARSGRGRSQSVREVISGFKYVRPEALRPHSGGTTRRGQLH